LKKGVGVLLFVILTLFCFGIQQSNELFGNGKYEVLFSEDPNGIYENYKIVIKNNAYIKQFSSGRKIDGKIVKIYPKTFVLTDSDEKEIPVDSLTEFQKSLMHWGKPCIELGQIKGDTMEFRTTFANNLHIQTNDGIIIKRTEK
jgi:hypothetical protein